MTKDELTSVTNEHLLAFQEALGLTHWTVLIDVADKAHEREFAATCHREINYDNAVLTFYGPTWESPELTQPLRTLRHELIHLMLSPFSLLDECLRAQIRGGKHAGAAAVRLSEYCEEQAVINVERALGDIEAFTKHVLANYPATPPAVTPPVTLLDVV